MSAGPHLTLTDAIRSGSVQPLSAESIFQYLGDYDLSSHPRNLIDYQTAVAIAEQVNGGSIPAFGLYSAETGQITPSGTAGEVVWNNASQFLATALFFSFTDRSGNPLSDYLNTVAVGDTLQLVGSDIGKFQSWEVVSKSQEVDHFEFNVIAIDSSYEFEDEEDVNFVINKGGSGSFLKTDGTNQMTGPIRTTGDFELKDGNELNALLLGIGYRYLVGADGYSDAPIVDYSNVADGSVPGGRIGLGINTQGIPGRYGRLLFNELTTSRNIPFQDKHYIGVADLSDIPSLVGYATETYVNNRIDGLTFKIHVDVASTGNVNIASAPATIDGLAYTRVLLKDQTDATQNGIYDYNGTGSPLARSSDGSTGDELVSATIPVVGGTVNFDTWWTITNNAITLGVTNITLTKTGGAGLYNAGTGLTLTGNTFAIDSTVVTLTGAQTLTSKTLTSPIINVTGDATGDMYYRSAGGAFTRLGIGSTARVLTVVGGIPAWSSALLEGGTSNSALRIGTGSTIGTAFSVAVGVSAGQTGTLLASTVNIGWTNQSFASANSTNIGTNVQLGNSTDGIIISRSSAWTMKAGSRTIRIGNTLNQDWSADAGAYSSLIIGHDITLTGQRSITWLGNFGTIDNTTAGVEIDGIVGVGQGVTIKAGRSTVTGANAYSDGISCTVTGYGARAKKSTLETGSFAHVEIYGRGTYCGISNTAVMGGGSTTDFFIGNGWVNRYYDNNTATVVSYDNTLYPTRIHGRDAYDDVDGTSINQAGGALELWAGRSTGSGTGGNISFKVVDGVATAGNVKQVVREVGRFTPTSFGIGFSTSGFLLQGSYTSTRLTAVTIWPDLTNRSIGDPGAIWQSSTISTQQTTTYKVLNFGTSASSAGNYLDGLKSNSLGILNLGSGFTGVQIGNLAGTIGFYNTTPIAQQTTAVASAVRIASGSTAITTADTFDGYTMLQIVKALRNIGILA